MLQIIEESFRDISQLARINEFAFLLNDRNIWKVYKEGVLNNARKHLNIRDAPIVIFTLFADCVM